MEKTIKIKGMSCGHCVGRIENALNNLEEVKDVKVHLKENTAKIELDSVITNQKIKEVIEDAGYDVIEIE